MHTKCPLTTTTMPNDRTRGSSRMQQDERLLLEYAETGNREAFEELVRLNEQELYSYLHHFLGDAQLAEDAFQLTFLQLHLKCRQFESGRRLRPWLYAIANNQAVDLLRRNRRHKAVSLSTAAGDADTDNAGQPLGDLLETKDSDPSNRLILTEDRDKVRLAVKRIPAKARKVLILIMYKGLRYREVAQMLGIPLGTVKSRMNTALRGLRDTLGTTKHTAA